MFVDDAIDFDCTILCVIAKSDALFAVITDLCRIQIAQIAFAAFNAFTIIQNAGTIIHIIFSPILNGMIIIARLNRQFQA